MGEELNTVKNLSGWRTTKRFGHLRQKTQVGEIESVECQGEEVIYREIYDADQTKPRDLYYLIAFGYAEGEPYDIGSSKKAQDYRSVPEEDREEVRKLLEELESKEAVWQDG